jgi:hypothetical protein
MGPLTVRLILDVVDENNQDVFHAERTWHAIPLDQVRTMGLQMPAIYENLTVAAGQAEPERPPLRAQPD